jgi:hypothetical protein
MNNPQVAYTQGQASLEELIDDGAVSNRIARSRFLRLSGAALFGAAATAFLPRAAWAHCPETDVHPCFGYPLCPPKIGCENRESNCCSNQNQRCSSDCDSFGPLGCPSGEVCWYCCHNGTRYKCCDCRDNANSAKCICRFIVGTCSCGNCPGPTPC